MTDSRERGAGGLPVPGDSENKSSYSYDLVSNPSLREFLEQFENKVVKNISSWPLPATSAIEHAEALTGLEGYKIYRCYEFIRNNNVIKLSSWNSGKKNRYGFEKDPLRAFFALLHIFNKNLFRRDKKYVKSLESIREALGSHPLADQFNAPSPSRQEVKQDSLLPKPVSLVEVRAKNEIDLSSGEFWEKPFGQAVKDLAISQIKDKTFFPLTRSQVAALLLLRDGYEAHKTIYELIKSGVLKRVEKVKGKYYGIGFEQVLVVGIALLHLERNYSFGEASGQLAQLLKGTSLEPYVGRANITYANLYHHNIFAENSPWIQFPLEPKLLEENQKQERGPWLLPKTDSFQKKEQASPIVIRPKPIEQKIETPKENTQIEKREKEIDEEEEEDTDEDEYEKNPLEKIPTITTDQLRHLSNLDNEEIQKIIDSLPTTPENIDFIRHAPLYVAQVTMFIQAVSRRSLSTFDPNLEYCDVFVFKNSLVRSIQFMTRYPQFKNLFQLFQGVKQLVEKDINKYWST